VVETADFRKLHDRPGGRTRDRPEVEGVFVEREVGTGPMGAPEVGGQHASQMACAENDDMVEALAPHRADELLGALPAQGEVLEGELAMAADEEEAETTQVEDESDHRAGIVAGWGPANQSRAGRTRFWRRTAARQTRHGGGDRSTSGIPA